MTDISERLINIENNQLKFVQELAEMRTQLKIAAWVVGIAFSGFVSVVTLILLK